MSRMMRTSAACLAFTLLISGLYAQFQQGTDGMVVIEMENYTDIYTDVEQNSTYYEWIEIDEDTMASYFALSDSNRLLPQNILNANPHLLGPPSNGVAMATSPDADYLMPFDVIKGDPTAGPCLLFDVVFTQTDTHYVWIRGCNNPTGIEGSSDSAYLGIDDEYQDVGGNKLEWAWREFWFWSSYRSIGNFPGDYYNPNHERKYIVVDTPGLHTVNVWMREDGSIMDKMIITSDKDWTPSDTMGVDTAGAYAFPESPTVAVDDIQDILPVNHALIQNYPNPFNPSTTLYFKTQAPGHVTIKIYNLVGNEMITLVNESLQAGSHQVTWDSRDATGNRVESGVYFYRMETATQTLTNKMLLLK